MPEQKPWIKIVSIEAVIQYDTTLTSLNMKILYWKVVYEIQFHSPMNKIRGEFEFTGIPTIENIIKELNKLF